MSADQTRMELEQTVQELQVTSQQSAAVQAQVKELEQTLILLSTQDADRPVFKQSGPVLIEVGDRAALVTELTESRDTLAGHAERLTEREAELRAAYEQLIKRFESA